MKWTTWRINMLVATFNSHGSRWAMGHDPMSYVSSETFTVFAKCSKVSWAMSRWGRLAGQCQCLELGMEEMTWISIDCVSLCYLYLLNIVALEILFEMRKTAQWVFDPAYLRRASSLWNQNENKEKIRVRTHNLSNLKFCLYSILYLELGWLGPLWLKALHRSFWYVLQTQSFNFLTTVKQELLILTFFYLTDEVLFIVCILHKKCPSLISKKNTHFYALPSFQSTDNPRSNDLTKVKI